MKVVQNDMVAMDWDAAGFVETKKAGFISAVHRYGDVAVAFRDGKVYTHVMEDNSVISFANLVDSIKTAHKQKDGDYPAFYEDYAEIYDGLEFHESTLEFLGIAEYKEDILARLEDLSGYWYVQESETLG